MGESETMKPALLVIDMQERFERMSRDMNIVGNVVNVVQACHRRNVPVFFTQHHDPEESGVLYSWWKNPIIKGSDRWRLISEIAAAVDEERDTIITEKTRYDAFIGTCLKEMLWQQGVDTVVVSGVLTNLCCETTARTAFVNDFSVIFLQDGNAAKTQAFHDASVMNLEYGFATIKKCQEFIDSLK